MHPEPQALEKGREAEPPMPCSEGQSQVAKWTGVGTASKLLSRPPAPRPGAGEGGTRGQGSSGLPHTPPVGTEPSSAPALPLHCRPSHQPLSSRLVQPRFAQQHQVPPASGSSPPPPAWAPPTLLFWMRRIRCSKQLLLRKVVWSTGRSSHASIKGMVSVEGQGSALPHPLPAAPTPAFSLLPYTAQSSLPTVKGLHLPGPPPQEPGSPYPPSMLTRRVTRASSGPGFGPVGQSVLRMRK